VSTETVEPMPRPAPVPDPIPLPPPSWASVVPGCDAEYPSVYAAPGGGVMCRCIVCARCGHHTGNNTQGHYWALCKVTCKVEDFHMCCPDDCELSEVAA
jgi:hypothetical protein